MAETASVVQGAFIDAKPGCSISFVSDSGEAQIITFDATISQNHSGESEITDEPVEKGADLTDHSRPAPGILSLEVLVTDYPLSIRGGGIGQPGFKGRSASIWDSLEQIRKDAQPVKVTTKLKTYDNMLIKSNAAPIDKNLKNALRITITLKAVNFATSQSVPVQVAGNRAGQSTANKGPQSTTAASGAQSKSFGASGIDFASNLLGGIF